MSIFQKENEWEFWKLCQSSVHQRWKLSAAQGADTAAIPPVKCTLKSMEAPCIIAYKMGPYVILCILVESCFCQLKALYTQFLERRQQLPHFRGQHHSIYSPVCLFICLTCTCEELFRRLQFIDLLSKKSAAFHTFQHVMDWWVYSFLGSKNQLPERACFADPFKLHSSSMVFT